MPHRCRAKARQNLSEVVAASCPFSLHTVFKTKRSLSWLQSKPQARPRARRTSQAGQSLGAPEGIEAGCLKQKTVVKMPQSTPYHKPSAPFQCVGFRYLTDLAWALERRHPQSTSSEMHFAGEARCCNIGHRISFEQALGVCYTVVIISNPKEEYIQLFQALASEKVFCFSACDQQGKGLLWD